MPPVVDRIFNLAAAAGHAIVTHWDAGADALPARQYIHAGDVAIDCEQFVVAIVGTTGTSTDLAAAGIIDQHQTSPAWAMRTLNLAISISRCAVVPDEGDPPSTDDLEDDALRIAQDGQSMLNALVIGQKLGEIAGCNGVVFQGWQVQGPLGGFVSGVLLLELLLLSG